MRYPHNFLGFPSRPKTRFQPVEDKSSGCWFHEVWLEGENPDTVEFVDVRWKNAYGQNQ